MICLGSILMSFCAWFTAFSNFTFEHTYGDGYQLIIFTEYLRNMALILCSRDESNQHKLIGNAITSDNHYFVLDEVKKSETETHEENPDSQYKTSSFRLISYSDFLDKAVLSQKEKKALISCTQSQCNFVIMDLNT